MQHESEQEMSQAVQEGPGTGSGIESPTHFRLEQVAEGVWAAIGTPGMGACANAGIIDLGDRTIVFDTFQTPVAARELRRAAEGLTGRPVSLVINSHFHADHTFGNQVFRDVPILSTKATRERVAEFAPLVINSYREDGPPYLIEQEELLATMEEGAAREAFALDLASTRWLVDSALGTEMRLPDLLIAERLTLVGSKRTVELQVHKGHTFSDIICLLPEERLCFVGDLVLVANHLWMGHGTTEGWFATLDRLAGLGFERLVPGHGPVGGAEWIGEARRYLSLVLDRAAAAVTRGSTPEEAAAEPMPEAYAAWSFPAGWARNMQAMVEELSQKKG